MWKSAAHRDLKGGALAFPQILCSTVGVQYITLMDRITEKHLATELERLNELMGTPVEPRSNGRANVGNIHTYDWAIVQYKNEAGGIATLARTQTKREAWEHLRSMQKVVRLFRLARGI